ncbi:MAG TPA: hypothetical protein VFK56_00660 [Mycobacterium sp.]|jgi:hypothetical protein|nr:hypothetical protein [Mycobacterium sp.]
MVDPLGFLLTSIRDDPTVAAITTRIRGEEPAQSDEPPLVLIRTFPITRDRRLPIGRYQYLIQTYGTSYKQAAQLRSAVSDTVQDLEPRVSASGVGIYQSFTETEGQAQLDPDTQWPFHTLIVVVWAATTVIA